MTWPEAKQQIKQGKKVTHYLLENTQYIYLDGHFLKDESNFTIGDIRDSLFGTQSDAWDDGWKLYNPQN